MVLGVHSRSSGQSFTAEGFCQNPQAFICGQNANQMDPALRQRILDIVERLKQRYPSFSEFIEQRGFEPNLEELVAINGEFRLYLGRRAVENYLELSPELANLPQTDVDFTHAYVTPMNTVATDYLLIPEKEIGQYLYSLRQQFGQVNGFSGEQNQSFFTEMIEIDPILNQANADFGLSGPLDLEDINDELSAAMRELFSEEIALGHSRHQSQLGEYKENVRETLLELGYPAGSEEIDTMLSRASFNLAPRDHVSCNSSRRLYVNNAVIETESGRILRCEDNYILFSNQEHMNVFSNHHELGHLFDHERVKNHYHPSYVQCINDDLGSALHSGHGHRSVAEDVDNSMVELTADYIGVAATVRYMRQNNLSQTESLRLLQREFQGLYCNDLGASTLVNHGHADNEVRLNRILGGSPQLQEYFGCQRFQNSVPVNPCHPFQDNSQSLERVPGGSSGPIEN
jgi:hypothetical protein